MQRYILERMDLAVLQAKYREALSEDGRTVSHEACAAAHIEAREDEGLELVSFSWWDANVRCAFVFRADSENAKLRRRVSEMEGMHKELTAARRSLKDQQDQIALLKRELSTAAGPAHPKT